MAYPYYILYHANLAYAPGCKLYHPEASTGASAPIVTLAGSFAAMLSESWRVIGYEAFNALNQLTGSDTINAPGTIGGDVQTYKYCSLIQLDTVVVGGHRSIKYVHGMSELAFEQGLPTADFLSRVSAFGNALVSLNFRDMNGQPVAGASYNGPSKRNRVRRRPA